MNYDGLGWWILSTLDVCFWCTMSFPWLILHVLNLSGWMIISINMLSGAPKSYLIVCLLPIWWMQRAALLHDKSRWHHTERDGYGGAGESKLTQVSDHHYRYIACNEFCDWITATIGAAKQPNLFTSSPTKTHLKPSPLFSPPLPFTNRLSSMSLSPATHNPQPTTQKLTVEWRERNDKGWKGRERTCLRVKFWRCRGGIYSKLVFFSFYIQPFIFPFQP